jgi:hypothetical protein
VDGEKDLSRAEHGENDEEEERRLFKDPSPHPTPKVPTPGQPKTQHQGNPSPEMASKSLCKTQRNQSGWRTGLERLMVPQLVNEHKSPEMARSRCTIGRPVRAQ